MNTLEDKTGWLAKFILLPGLILILSVSLAAPQRANAQSIGSAAASGVASGLASCAGQIGKTIAASAASSLGLSKAVSVADVSTVPTFDAQTQSANLTNNIVRTSREACMDAIAYNVAKQVLNQLADSTLAWVESGFTEFGQEGNKAFVGNINNFLSNVGQQTFNRFMNEVTTANSPLKEVCSAFSRDILRQVGKDYFQENPQPAGMAWDSGMLPDERDLASSTADCDFGDLEPETVQAFLNGDFQEGGWQAYRSMVENPESNPVGAYLENKKDLKQRIQQAKDTNLTELRNNNGWLSEVACPGDGSLNSTTSSCTDENGNTLSEPTIKTPGTVVNNQINRVVESDFRRLELADEVNEIVGALADQLVSQVIGGGTGGGEPDATKGLFSKAAQEKSDALGSFAEAADPDSDYGNQLQEEYVRNTLNDQITLEQDLLTVVQDLPDTNDVSKLESRINQCLNNTQNNSGDPSFDEDNADKIEDQLQTLTSAYTSAFPSAENTGDKEVGPQRIDWVGNDIDNWNYGDSKGLDSCDSVRDAYNFSYIPERSTQSWQAFVCIPKFDGGSDGVGKFNETGEFDGKFVEFSNEDGLRTDYGNGSLHEYLNIGKETSSGETKRVLYRNARNNKVKIDWNGNGLDWSHYDPLAGKLANNIPDQIFAGNNHTSRVFWPKMRPPNQDPETALFSIPGRYIQESEAERVDQVANTVGEINRYGVRKCDNRAFETDARSYVVKPYDDVWTIQECERFNIGINAASGPEVLLGSTWTGIVGQLIGGPAGALQGYLVGNLEDKDAAFALYRFVDIPMSEYEDITEDGEKPPAFREAQGAVDNKGQFIDEIENLLGSTSSTPVDGSFTAPEFQPDNLYEVKHDLNTLATSGDPTSQKIAERQQTLNNRFGRIEKRFHTDDDLSSASDALSVTNPTSPNSVYNQLKNTADANGCIPESDWEQPVDDDGDEDDEEEGGVNEPAIINFTASRSGANNRFISISWEAAANQCIAQNDNNFGQWSGDVGISGTRVIRSDSAVSLSLECRANGDVDTQNIQIPPAQPSPFEDISNPRIE